jgi:hypothetical protein
MRWIGWALRRLIAQRLRQRLVADVEIKRRDNFVARASESA